MTYIVKSCDSCGAVWESPAPSTCICTHDDCMVPAADAPPRAPAATDEFETRKDGMRVRKDRWEWGIRRIVALLWGNRQDFEIDDVVAAVRELVPKPANNGEDAGLCDFAARGCAPAALIRAYTGGRTSTGLNAQGHWSRKD